MQNCSDYFIRIDGQLVAVSEEVYLVYYRSRRREKYFERDIKTEMPVRDKTGEVIGYRPSREDSFDRLIAAGAEFIDTTTDVEREALCAVVSAKLHEALAALSDAERALIEALFFANNGRGMSERDYAVKTGIPWQTVHSRKIRILAKLQKLLEI